MPTLLATAAVKPSANLLGLQLLDTKAVNARNSVFGASFTHNAFELRNPSANVLSRWIVEGDWKLIASIKGRTGEDVADHLCFTTPQPTRKSAMICLKKKG